MEDLISERSKTCGRCIGNWPMPVSIISEMLKFAHFCLERRRNDLLMNEHAAARTTMTTTTTTAMFELCTPSEHIKRLYNYDLRLGGIAFFRVPEEPD
ncbi:hypothetical protein KIN20_006584 [Parelaphostrongylus tenuis]|uniref:Uncharacterized protein n=1 Tax=Parelaphostrongylus tenuis TaxID=148309 RepID=A0AAD5M6B2_PARTN|nr:hypothetical protein KIN20_006584 [Parelaphostrongylus tenuis]